jgi:uncharacterized integral membrane protein
MFVLGLLVLAAAAVGGVELVLANRDPVIVHMWNWTWHVDAFWLAVIGAVVITAIWLALGAMRVGFGHTRRLRRERRELAAENRELAKRARSAEARPVTRPLADGPPAQAQPYPAAPAAPAATAPATAGDSAVANSRR